MENLRIDSPSPSVMEPCEFATVLPEDFLSQAEVEEFWIEDRRRLIECKGKHEGLVDFIQDLVSKVR